VLVDGDDLNEPVSDAVRSILDGHIVLARNLAAANHYPAVDVLNSISRVMPDVVDPVHLASASAIRDMLANYREAEDLINIGAYVRGSNPKVDLAINKIESIRHFVRQGIHERSTYDEALQGLFAMT
jgi:flagellum-specific ATP synthase